MTKVASDRETVFFKKQCSLINKLAANNTSDLIIFDVGAHHGESILNYRKFFPDCQIYSFEANPTAASKLYSEYGSNVGIVIVDRIVCDHSGEMDFYVTNSDSASSPLPPEQRLLKISKNNNFEYSVVRQKCIKLDEFCTQNDINGIDVLKIDTQGAELLVLKGAERILKSGLVSIIYTEITLAETYEKQTTLGMLASFLEDHDFLLWDIEPFLWTKTGQVWAANAIFIHKEKELIARDLA